LAEDYTHVINANEQVWQFFRNANEQVWQFFRGFSLPSDEDR
jgi:hypothetical protein